MYAVQEQSTSMTTKDLKIVKDSSKEPSIEKTSLSKNSAVSIKKEQSKTLRRLHGVIGHRIMKISHRKIIDKRRRIASNF